MLMLSTSRQTVPAFSLNGCRKENFFLSIISMLLSGRELQLRHNGTIQQEVLPFLKTRVPNDAIFIHPSTLHLVGRSRPVSPINHHSGMVVMTGNLHLRVCSPQEIFLYKLPRFCWWKISDTRKNGRCCAVGSSTTEHHHTPSKDDSSRMMQTMPTHFSVWYGKAAITKVT
jgi:hypothetical protein